MKVKDLVAKLEKLDQELELYEYEWPDEPLHLQEYRWRGSHVMTRACDGPSVCKGLPIIERYTDGSPHKATAILVE